MLPSFVSFSCKKLGSSHVSTYISTQTIYNSHSSETHKMGLTEVPKRR